jgi:hypothetical protein
LGVALLERLEIEVIDAIFNTLESCINIFPIEWQPTTKQHIQNNTTSPVIDLFPIIPRDNLRRHIHDSPSGLIFQLVFPKNLGNAKINNLDHRNVILTLEQYILWLEIPVTDIVVMKIGNSR